MPARVATAVAPPIRLPASRGRRGMLPQNPEQPVKKQSKWSPDEDALIIELRGTGMKWEDISKQLPGRSAISCRLHYQNYLERRSEWDEERKNKLARLYERFKAEMWAKVAEELQVPWRAAEAMHWQLGETEMARRAGVVPFSLAAVNVESGHRNSPSRTHAQPYAHGNLGRDSGVHSPRPIYSRRPPATPGNRTTGRRETISAPPAAPHQHVPGSYMVPQFTGHDQNDRFYISGPGLAPIESQPSSRHTGLLPGVAELTTGVSPYNHSLGTPTPQHPATQGEYFPPPGGIEYGMQDSSRVKRRASPSDAGPRETNHRRRV